MHHFTLIFEVINCKLHEMLQYARFREIQLENFWYFQTNMEYWLQCLVLHGSGGQYSQHSSQATRFELILAKLTRNRKYKSRGWNLRYTLNIVQLSESGELLNLIDTAETKMCLRGNFCCELVLSLSQELIRHLCAQLSEESRGSI